MTDEKFTFIEDLRDKKRTATGAHHKRTHCGKGGAIRFPSDFKTKKEREAMNGEVKSYKLNDPMGWEEFKAMPDDVQKLYITALREKYNVSDTNIFKMMGINQTSGSRYLRTRGMSAPERGGREKWDADGWYAWVNGVPLEAKEEAAPEKCDEEVLESAEKCDKATELAEEVANIFAAAERRSIPGWGQMELEGTVEECANTLKHLLADSSVKLTVTWVVK